MAFPKDFLWGAATASYQIEGAAQEYGRGECIWTRFSKIPGKVHNGDNGDVACDHYHRYADDVAVMKSLGLHAYRFSVSWPRVLPQGTGTVNAAGLDFYDRLVDELLKAEITPYLTLYHWDLPQALQDRGGWSNPDSPRWFADYAGLMAQRLGDRVKNWSTLNEPWVVAFLGNWLGYHAPGLTDLPTAYKVAHHLMLAHGEAVPVIRQQVPDGRVGITVDLIYADPASDSEADRAAAWREDGFKNRWFLDPIFKGQYPQDIVDWFNGTDTLAGIDLDSVKTAAVPIDFLGLNYYTRGVFTTSDDGVLKSASVPPADARYTGMGWEVYPDGLRSLLVRVGEEYAPEAIYITENGASYEDVVTNGQIHDPDRVAYLDAHFSAVSQAIEEGAPVKGYFVWSLLDNFEWAYGYDKRFGIIYVDYETQQRIPKQSALFFRDYITAEHETA
jgi:beta-glucosidase